MGAPGGEIVYLVSDVCFGLVAVYAGLDANV